MLEGSRTVSVAAAIPAVPCLLVTASRTARLWLETFGKLTTRSMEDCKGCLILFHDCISTAESLMNNVQQQT